MLQEELRILYADRVILVCKKPPGVPVQGDRSGAYDLASRLLNYLAASESGALSGKASGRPQIPYLAVVHRLDRPVGGVMVFAKTKQAAARLSRQIQERETEKRYYCVLTGIKGSLGKEWETLTDYLVMDTRTNLSRLAAPEDTGAKEARLRIRLLEQERAAEQELALAEVELLTGRHHQIRVQMTGISEGIWGDTKYNSGFRGKKGWFSLALFSSYLAFFHPSTGEKLQFCLPPEGEVFERFAYIQRLRER